MVSFLNDILMRVELIHFLITGSFDFNNLNNLDTIVRDKSISFTIGSTVFLVILVVIAALLKKKNEVVKQLLFWSMILIISVNTLYLAGATIYKNQRSITGGPVHWHADFEVYNCGKEVDLVDPTGWSNKIGTPVFHEHNDKRIHVEGVVLHQEDVSLGRFFNVVGGNLTSQNLAAPLNDGTVMNLNNGDYCGDGPGMVQVFVYQTSGSAFSQKKLLYPEDYILSGHSGVPPGDCIIVEFDQPKERTAKLCQSYKVQQQLGKITGQ